MGDFRHDGSGNCRTRRGSCNKKYHGNKQNWLRHNRNAATTPKRDGVYSQCFRKNRRKCPRGSLQGSPDRKAESARPPPAGGFHLLQCFVVSRDATKRARSVRYARLVKFAGTCRLRQVQTMDRISRRLDIRAKLFSVPAIFATAIRKVPRPRRDRTFDGIIGR